jgi:hypothetical protein
VRGSLLAHPKIYLFDLGVRNALLRRALDRRRLRGFEALAEHSPTLKRRIVVYLGPRRMKLGGAEVIPLREFLDELPV